MRYRDQVLEQLGALLLMYPRGRQFAKDFPDLRATVRRHFEEGVAPASAASQIAADMLADILRQLGAKERATVLAGILAAPPEAAESLAARRLGGDRTRKAEAVAFATELASVAIFMGRRMAEEGTLRRDELRHLLAAIEGALGAEGQPLAGSFEDGEESVRR